MRTLAVDLGAKRVGLAMSDEGGEFATPYDVLQVKSADEALEPVCRLIARESVRRVVIGLPLNMDDSVGPAAKRAIEWGRKLQVGCKCDVLFVDERLSSFAADEQLRRRKRGGERLTRDQRKRRLDALAAAQFLQDFLDGKNPAHPV